MRLVQTHDFTGASALSIDLFDTLLLRAVADPLDVFASVATRAADRGEIHRHITPGQFRVLRRGAEEAARRDRRAVAQTSEVTLSEIYWAMPAGTLIAPPETLAATELAVESEIVYPHPGTLDTVLAAHARGLRLAILSDTYFSSLEVTQLLRAAGIDPAIFNPVMTSSEEGVSKLEGGLFARLLARWADLRPSSIVHLGDHPRADVTRAQASGLGVAPHDTGEDATRDALRLEALRYGATHGEIASLRRLSVSLAPPVQDEERWWFTTGASVFGPLLSAFADWIVASCVRDGITTVRPLMREGGVLTRLIAKAADCAGVELDVKPLYASRASTWLASIAAFDNGDAARLLQRRRLTVAEGLATLGLRLESAPDSIRSHPHTRFEAASQTLTASGRSLHAELLAYLERAEVRVEIDYHSALARRLLRSYVEQECGSSSHVALVDVGFHGSTGMALERATSGAGRHFHQFLLFGADNLRRLWTEGRDVRVYGAGPGESADLAGPISRYPALLETLFMDGGTTLGYRQKNNIVVPVLDEVLVPETQQANTAACRAGILAYQDRWLDWRLLRSSCADAVVASPRVLVESLHRLLTMPTFDEASRLGALVHEDNDGGNSIRTIADASHLPSELSLEQFLRDAEASASDSSQEWLWPAGVCEQRWPGMLEERWRQAIGTRDGAPPAIPAVARKVKAAGVRRCVIWGAGEAGAALIRACRAENIEIQAVTDSNPALWGSTVEGVAVVSPEEARRQDTNAYAIGSLAFAADIELALKRRYSAAAVPVHIFSAAQEIAA